MSAAEMPTVDSRARGCVAGHLVAYLWGNIEPGEPTTMFVRTSHGTVVMRDCRVLDAAGRDLLAGDPGEAGVQAINDIFRDALLVDIEPGPGERYTLTLADGYELTGTDLTWDPADRPTVELQLVPQELAARECGCLVTDSGYAAAPCADHQPERGADGEVVYEEVDGGTWNASCGACQECGEVVDMVGYFIFAPCACVRD